LLSIQSVREDLQDAWPQAYPHQTLHAQDQRQGRALHPDQPARMGLRPRLQHLRRARRRTAKMAPSLQLASASWQYRRQATHQPPRTDREQPVEAPQLGTIIPTTLLEQVDALTERRRAGNSVLVRRRVFMGIANCRG